MTIREIIRTVDRFKPMSERTLYSHLRALRIKPIGARQRPQRYPENTAAKVLGRLGYRKARATKARRIAA